MKITKIITLTFMVIVLASCSKESNKTQIQADNNYKIAFPDLSGIDFQMPDVPPYTGPAEDPDSAEERGAISVDPGSNQLQL